MVCWEDPFTLPSHLIMKDPKEYAEAWFGEILWHDCDGMGSWCRYCEIELNLILLEPAKNYPPVWRLVKVSKDGMQYWGPFLDLLVVNLWAPRGKAVRRSYETRKYFDHGHWSVLPTRCLGMFNIAVARMVKKFPFKLECKYPEPRGENCGLEIYQCAYKNKCPP